uniref:F-box domain-containing protein n=1 Tax=Leersia perrieri TaxID=77586 RepID=A0A0D9WN09_9ORYZ
MEKDLVRRAKRLKSYHQETILKKTRSHVQLQDLPGDLLSTILSKLPLKDAVRTGVLSSKWKDAWKVCPKLKFDGGMVCGGQQCTQKFIDIVNAVMKQHQTPINFLGHANQYRFPFELLDDESISRLQHIQLSYTSFELPTQFSGFINLTTLDLHLIRVTKKVLQDMLSNCINLEWLSMVRCHLNDELKVARPLSNLLYLRVAHCKITKIELNAMKLRTFVFRGMLHPIDLGQAPELKDTSLHFFCSATLQHAFTALATLLPSVQNLTFRANVSLEFNTVLAFTHRGLGPVKRLPRCPHSYLKNVHITGYVGSIGEIEPLVYIVENAAALEQLTIKTEDELGDQGKRILSFHIHELETRWLHGLISPNTKLCIV